MISLFSLQFVFKSSISLSSCLIYKLSSNIVFCLKSLIASFWSSMSLVSFSFCFSRASILKFWSVEPPICLCPYLQLDLNLQYPFWRKYLQALGCLYLYRHIFSLNFQFSFYCSISKHPQDKCLFHLVRTHLLFSTRMELMCVVCLE